MLRPTVGVPRAVLVLSVYEPPVRELVSFTKRRIVSRNRNGFPRLLK